MSTGLGLATLEQVAATVRPIALDELNAEAALMQRTDRKYLVTGQTFATLMGMAGELLGDGLRVLDIETDRVLGYESVYYDSPDLIGFRAHVQGRRRRYKIRSRRYLETGASFVEVKYKSRLDVTSKVRTAYPDAPEPGGPVLPALSEHGVAFAGAVISEVYALQLPTRMDPVLRTTNRRATFLIGPHGPAAGGRMTVDVALRLDNADGSSRMHGDLLLIETKSDGSSLVVDHLLRALGERPVAMSKYCVGISLLHPGAAGNKWRRITRNHFEAA